jgi:hypothetical protein
MKEEAAQIFGKGGVTYVAQLKKDGYRPLCTLLLESAVCRTVKRHYEIVNKWLCDKSGPEQKRTHFSTHQQQKNARKCFDKICFG